jgi:uncharacterized protein YkwD
MKTLIFILLFFISFNSLPQSISDCLYKKINHYRKTLGLNELYVDERAKVFNDQQLKYMIETSTVPLDHSQKIKTKYPKTFNTFLDRVNYVYKNKYEYVGENLVSLLYEGSDEYIANKIFNLWINSPTHKEIILSYEPEGFYINFGISTKLKTPTTEITGVKIIYCVLTTYK